MSKFLLPFCTSLSRKRSTKRSSVLRLFFLEAPVAVFFNGDDRRSNCETGLIAGDDFGAVFSRRNVNFTPTDFVHK